MPWRAALETCANSRETLAVSIKSQLHLRQGADVTSFDERLAPPEAGLASQIVN